MSLLLALTASGGATTAPTVVSAFTWSAISQAPIYDTIVSVTPAAFAWQAFGPTPIIQSDTVAPTISASFTWQAFGITPIIESTERVESIGNYAGYDQHVRIVRAQRTWQALASRPIIGRPAAQPIIVPTCVAMHAWRAVAHAPRGLLLRRNSASATLIRSSSTGRAQLIRSAASIFKRSR